MSIQAITFDFWATLYQSRTVDYTQRLLHLREAIERGSGVAVSMEQLETAVTTARQTWNRTWVEAHRTMSAAEWLVVMLQTLNVSLPPAHLVEIQAGMENSILDHPPIPAAEIGPVLARLSSRYRLAVISDTGITPGRVLRQILEKDKLAPYFTHLTFSDEVGCSKPHATTFLTTLNHLGAAPAEAVHVGDLLRTDIAGAKGVGMRAVQYIGLNRDETYPGNSQTLTPDAVIQKHTELEALLRRWNGAGSRYPNPK